MLRCEVERKMNKKLQKISDEYNSRKLIEANRNTLYFYLDNKGIWLRDILGTKRNKFINEMAAEIEDYQRWQYLRGLEKQK